MKFLNIIFVIILLFTLISCSQSDYANDPKAQGSRMLEKAIKQARKEALIEAKKLLKEDKDFIIIADGIVCTYEKELPRMKKTEIGMPIDEIFTGEYVEGKQYYASKLPTGTKVYYVTNKQKDYRYAEVSEYTDKVYKCTNYELPTK